MSVEVREWLEASGFGEYAELFAAHRIDIETLPVLTNQHLQEIGIPLGPRIRLLAAIAQTPPAPARVLPAAERRHMTVVFVDLVGSTALSARLDPEDFRQILRAYQGVVAREVERCDGHVAQYLGDGAMIYFGYPTAHEDDAERAVRAAIAIAGEVTRVGTTHRETLAVRIGIATGLVVVGDMLGAGPFKEHAIVGETPNLAARLQVSARAGEIVISERTRLLLGDAFVLEDLGPQDVRGLSRTVRAFRVVGERAVESRFEAHRRAAQLTAMVGRDRELGMLRALWSRACSGNGGIVLITGEPGIGKSRLVRALQDALQSEPLFRLKCQCSPYHADTPLFPIVEQLKHAIGDTTAASTPLDKLKQFLQSASGDEIKLIAASLGLVENPDVHGALSPQQQRSQLFDALRDQLRHIAAVKPMLCIIEDIHWIDPTTLELVQRCARNLDTLRVLAILTARPESNAENLAVPLERIELSRLDASDIASMVADMTGGKPMPPTVLGEIIAKTDGVPLFVEELTKMMVESDFVHETTHAYVTGAAQQRISVPASLHDSLMARLDRLRPFKEVAQIAACIGREFGYELLASVARVPEPILHDALDRLVASGLILQSKFEGERSYVFKHALVRDAAYGSLLLASRQQIHARLVAKLRETVGAAPEIVAHHAAHAALPEIAIEYWRKAAAEAIARPAYKEAIAHLTRALALAEQMEDTPVWQERRLGLLLALGQASMPLHGYSHAETAAIFARAAELAGAMGGTRLHFPIQHATWVARYVRGEQDRALEIARQMLDRALAEANDGYRLAALRSLGISQMVTGAPLLALASFDKAREVAVALQQRSQAQRLIVANRYAADPEIATEFHVGLTLWSLGRMDEARSVVDAALAAARRIGHPHTLGHALAHRAIFAVTARDVAHALSISREGMEFAARHDMELWSGYSAALHGYALALSGDFQPALALLERGFACLDRTQTGAMVPMHRAMQAFAFARLGRYAEAAASMALVERELSVGSERYYWPECQRLLGDCLRLFPEADAERIDAAYTRALSFAQTQQSIGWQLYAASSLCDWWIERDQRESARELLTNVLAAFAQPPDSPVFAKAHALLDSLMT